MLRLAVVRGSTSALRLRAAPVVAPRVLRRYESSVPPDIAAAVKAAKERSDDLQRDWDAKVITYEELLPKTQSPSPDSYLIDVREQEEVIQGMIPSAVNLPLSVMGNSLRLAPDVFKATHGFDKPQQSQEVTFYCRSGVRSTSASDVAKRNGFTNILNYKGSWLEWTEKQKGQK